RLPQGPSVNLAQQVEADFRRPIDCAHSSIRGGSDCLDLQFYPSRTALSFDFAGLKAVDDLRGAIQSGALVQLSGVGVAQLLECRTYLFLGGPASRSNHRSRNALPVHGRGTAVSIETGFRVGAFVFQVLLAAGG